MDLPLEDDVSSLEHVQAKLEEEKNVRIIEIKAKKDSEEEALKQKYEEEQRRLEEQHEKTMEQAQMEADLLLMKEKESITKEKDASDAHQQQLELELAQKKSKLQMKLKARKERKQRELEKKLEQVRQDENKKIQAVEHQAQVSAQVAKSALDAEEKLQQQRRASMLKPTTPFAEQLRRASMPLSFGARRASRALVVETTPPPDSSVLSRQRQAASSPRHDLVVKQMRDVSSRLEHIEELIEGLKESQEQKATDEDGIHRKRESQQHRLDLEREKKKKEVLATTTHEPLFVDPDVTASSTVRDRIRMYASAASNPELQRYLDRMND